MSPCERRRVFLFYNLRFHPVGEPLLPLDLRVTDRQYSTVQF